MTMRSFTTLLAVAGSSTLASAITIADITGTAYLSPYSGQTVTGIEGLVTAAWSSGIWIRSTTPDDDDRTSDSLYVYSTTIGSQVAVGDIITLGGTVAEYRSGTGYVYMTELKTPTAVTVVSSNNTVTPLVIGIDTLPPPTEQFSSLDEGDIFAVPNDQYNISTENPTLDPATYGMDFWQSLSGEYVTVSSAMAIGPPNSYGEVWVTGDWPVTGRNSRGGLTMLAGDANPEAVIIGDPLDGTSNPDDVILGDKLENITGVIYQQYGFYYLLPDTAISVTSSPTGSAPVTTLVSDKTCKGLSFGDYNIENLTPDGSNLELIAEHIGKYMQAPSLVFVQEIQDNNGATDDGVVNSDTTLNALVAAISNYTTVAYDYAYVSPNSDTDGGEPGGNIRQAYLYDSSVLALVAPNTGGANDSAYVNSDGTLNFNPGRIEPLSAAWDASRKPLVAHWQVLGNSSAQFYTVNLHLTSKGGSSSLLGDYRTPINLGVDQRTLQAQVTGAWIANVTSLFPSTPLITAGDCNEYSFAPPLQTFVDVSGLTELDVAAGIAPEERYTYIYGSSSEQLDHTFVNDAILALGDVVVEHIHVNTWGTLDGEASDHDPSVFKVSVC